MIAIEDIHWADEGMLDLIEYLARWVRGPVLIVCLARDELLDRRPGWGGGRRNATTIALEPLTQDEARELVAALLPGGNGNGNGQPTSSPRSPSAPPATRCSPRRWSTGSGRRARRTSRRCPETVHAVLAARLDSLPPPERRVLQHAAGGRPDLLGGLAAPGSTPRRIDLEDARRRFRRRTWSCRAPAAGSPGEHEYAFKHALIRDVAYGTLPKSVRAASTPRSGASSRSGPRDRSEGVVAMVADHYGRAAALGADADIEPAELERDQPTGAAPLEAAGDAAASLYSNQEALGHYETRARRWPRARPGDAARGSARSSATSRCGWGASTRRSRSGSDASTTTAARRTSRGSATCTARSAPASGTRASARPRSTTTRRASTC